MEKQNIYLPNHLPEVLPANKTPIALSIIAAGRDHINTSEFAHAIGRADQTIRKNYCTTGECYGIRPVKFGNKLLWSVAEIANLLNGGL